MLTTLTDIYHHHDIEFGFRRKIESIHFCDKVLKIKSKAASSENPYLASLLEKSGQATQVAALLKGG